MNEKEKNNERLQFLLSEFDRLDTEIDKLTLSPADIRKLKVLVPKKKKIETEI